METIPTIIIPAQSLAQLETRVKALLSHMPAPIRTYEMSTIQDNYNWLLQDEPGIDDSEAKCRVYAAWLERREM